MDYKTLWTKLMSSMKRSKFPRWSREEVIDKMVKMELDEARKENLTNEEK